MELYLQRKYTFSYISLKFQESLFYPIKRHPQPKDQKTQATFQNVLEPYFVS